jgi:hypothetical protein
MAWAVRPAAARMEVSQRGLGVAAEVVTASHRIEGSPPSVVRRPARPCADRLTSGGRRARSTSRRRRRRSANMRLARDPADEGLQRRGFHVLSSRGFVPATGGTRIRGADSAGDSGRARETVLRTGIASKARTLTARAHDQLRGRHDAKRTNSGVAAQPVGIDGRLSARLLAPSVGPSGRL